MIGVSVDAAAVGLHYGARSRGGVLDVSAMDRHRRSIGGPGRRQRGLRVAITDLIMRDPQRTAAFVGYAGSSHPMIDSLINSADRPEPSAIRIFAPSGLGEVTPGAPLAQMIMELVGGHDDGPLRDGDIVVATSKIISKAEGPMADRRRRDDLVRAESSVSSPGVAPPGSSGSGTG